MTNVRTTQLNGLIKQLESIPSNIQALEGYEETDYNPLWEAVVHIDEAISQLHYALKETKSDE